MKKKNNQNKSEYKYFIQDSIACIVFTLIGFLLLFFGVEEPICIILIFSFVIFMFKMISALQFSGIIKKIIMSIYWILFFIVVAGLILSVFNIKPNNYKIYDVNIINYDGGLITNIEINQNGDVFTSKLIHPTIFDSNMLASNENSIDYKYITVISKSDNKKIMYLLYSTNIGLHILYVGFDYLFIFSILLFLLLIIKIMFFDLIVSIIKKRKKKLKK